MWYHLSLFLDAGELGVAYTGISTATALSQVIGGPLAAALLLLDGTWGLHGWQWLFICEGLPTVMFAAVLKVIAMRMSHCSDVLSKHTGPPHCLSDCCVQLVSVQLLGTQCSVSQPKVCNPKPALNQRYLGIQTTMDYLGNCASAAHSVY